MKTKLKSILAVALCVVGLAAFAGLQDQINSASDGAMVTMMGDHNGDLIISAARTVNIDMAGHKVTGDVTSSNGGTLTFKNGDLTYGEKFTGDSANGGIVLKEGVRCAANQKDYVASDAKMTFKKIDGVDWYVVVANGDVKPIVVAERWPAYSGQGEDRMQYTDLATAFVNAKDGETIKLLRDVKEGVTVKNTLTFDMQGYLLDGSITAANTGTVRTNWLQNVNMTGDLKTQGDLRIIMENGTNTHDSAFTGTNLEFAEGTVFGYKQAKGYIADDMAMAKTEADRWQVANMDDLQAAVGTMDDDYQHRQAFLSVADAVRLIDVDDSAVTEPHLIHLLADQSEPIVLDMTAIGKNLLFDANGHSFASTALVGPDGYVIATTAEGYLHLVEEDDIVAEIDGTDKQFTSIADALKVATDGQTINLLQDWAESVTLSGQTNNLSFGAFELNGPLATSGNGRLVVLDGTNSWTGTFSGNLELREGTVYGKKHTEGNFLPSDEYDYAKVAADRWEVVKTNDLAVRIGDEKFKSPEEAIALASSGDTLVFLKAWGSDITVDDDGLAKNLKFDPNGFEFTGSLLHDGYTTAMDETYKLYLAADDSIVARIGTRLAFESLTTAVKVAKDGDTVEIVQTVNENVGPLSKKISLTGGTNIWGSVFSASPIKLTIKSGTYGYKQSEDYLVLDYVFAKVAESPLKLWEVVLESDIVASTDDGELYTSFNTAVDLNENDTVISFYADFEGDIVLTQDEIAKVPKFNLNGKTFAGELTEASGDYVVATTAEGYLYLVEADDIVAEIEGTGKQFTSIAAALKVAADGQTINLLQDRSEDVTVNGQTNSFKFGACTLTGNLATDVAGKIIVQTGTNDYANAFTGPNLELSEGTVYGKKQEKDYLPEPHDDYDYAKVAADRWEVVKTNDLAVRIGDEKFKTPEEAIALAGYGDTLVFLKAWTKDVVLDANGLRKDLKFNPGGFIQAEMQIKADGYRLVQDGDHLFTLKPYGWVARVAEGTADELDLETFLDAMDYAYAIGEKEIKFLQDFPGDEFLMDGSEPDNILIPDEYLDYGFEFNPAGFKFPGELIGGDDQVTAMNDATNLFLAATDDIVAVYNHYRPRFTNVVTAVNLATNGTVVTVVKDCAGDATVAADITFETADGAVYDGKLLAGGKTVTTTLGSRFVQNPVDEIAWAESGLTITWDAAAENYVVVPAGETVAEFWKGGKLLVAFTNAAEAVTAVGTFRPFDDFRIGVNDSECSYDFNGWAKKTATFTKLVNVGTGTNVIENAELRGAEAVTGDVGTVVFDKGVRMPVTNTKFKTGGVKLIVKKGAYVNDPTEFCEEGYAGARRAAAGSELDDFYVIYPIEKIEVTAADDGHYLTLGDAFTNAPSDSVIRLFNNLPMSAAVPAGKAFTLTSDSEASATNVVGGTVTVAGTLTVSNMYFTTAKIVVKAGGTLVVGDDFVMSGATDGAVTVEDSGKIVINGSGSEIWDNNGTNVVVQNPTTGLLLVKDNDGDAEGGYNPCRIGIWCENYEAGQQFGTVDETSFPYPFYCDGDISVAEPKVYFTNDRDATLHHGMGAAIDGPANGAISGIRWVGGFQEALEEGNFLIYRSGNQLVWLARQAAPEQEDPEFLGATKGTITIATVPGQDYALVTNGIAFTNWMSATGATLTFQNMDVEDNYSLLKRLSITTSNIVSDVIADGLGIDYRSSVYDAAEIAAWFDDSAVTHTGARTLDEKAENDIVIVKAAANGIGYVVTMKKDSNRGAVIPDDAGDLKIVLNRYILRGAYGSGQSGIRFVEPADYDDYFPAEVTIEGLGRVVGAGGTNGVEAVDAANGADGQDGAAGITTDAGIHQVRVDLTQGASVYGGQGGNGGDAVRGQGGPGGKGGVAIAGEILLGVFTEDDKIPAVTGGEGGKGGTSTYNVGGMGGNGGDAIGTGVEAEIDSAKITGGKGGDGGASGYRGELDGTWTSVKAGGAGGNGGAGLTKPADITFVNDPDDVVVVTGGEGGIGGYGDPNGEDGEDGTSGKRSAPGPVFILGQTGTSLVIAPEKGIEYEVRLNGEPVEVATNGVPVSGWIRCLSDSADPWIFDGLEKATDYELAYRFYALSDAEPESFERVTDFRTQNYDPEDIAGFFGGDEFADVKLAASGTNYEVTVTDDLPNGIVLPDDLGYLLLDLNGHSITGTNGVEGVQSADGQAAIFLFDAGHDPETALDIVNTSEQTAEIRGGNGATGYDETSATAPDGGNGGAGIDMELLVEAWVRIGANITVRGGNGSDGASTNSGDAGRGGNGGDAVRYAAAYFAFINDGATLIGGDGGNGGDARNGKAGDGGTGGNGYFEDYATMCGQGGNGGQGGIGATPGAGGEGGLGEKPGIDGAVGDVKNVVRVDSVYYTSVADAINAATDNQTVTVVRDAAIGEEDFPEVHGTGVTLEVEDGLTLTVGAAIEVLSGKSLRVTRGRIVPANGTGASFLVDAGGTLEIDGGDVTGIDVVEGATLTLKDGQIDDIEADRDGNFTVTGGIASGISLLGGANFTVTGGFIDGEIDAAEDADVALRGGRYSVDPTPFIDEADPYRVRRISDEPFLDELDIIDKLGPGPYIHEDEILKRIFDPEEEEEPNLAANGLDDVLYEVFDALFVRVTICDDKWKPLYSYHEFSLDIAFMNLTEDYKRPAATGNVLITLRSDAPIWTRLVFTRLMDQPNFACKIQGELQDPEDDPPEIIDLRIGADAEGPLFGVRHPFALEDVTVTGGSDSIFELFGFLDPGTKTLLKVYESVPVDLIRTEVSAYWAPDGIMSEPLITPAAGGVKATLSIWDSQVLFNDTDVAIRTTDENGNFAMKVFVTGETYVCYNGGLNLHLTHYNQLEIGELTGEVRVAYDGYEDDIGPRVAWALTDSDGYPYWEHVKYDGSLYDDELGYDVWVCCQRPSDDGWVYWDYDWSQYLVTIFDDDDEYVGDFDSFAEANAVLKNGFRMRLNRDVELEDPIEFDKNFTLDGDQHRIIVNCLDGFTIKKGNVTIEDTRLTAEDDYRALRVTGSALVKLDAGTVVENVAGANAAVYVDSTRANALTVGKDSGFANNTRDFQGAKITINPGALFTDAPTDWLADSAVALSIDDPDFEYVVRQAPRKTAIGTGTYVVLDEKLVEDEIRPYIDLLGAAGQITTANSKITIKDGKDMEGSLVVATPYGWNVEKTLSDNDLVVKFVMNEDDLKPEIGHPDPAATPFSFDGTTVRIWVANAAEGFHYQIIGGALGDFKVLTDEYVEPDNELGVDETRPKPLLLEWTNENPDPSMFFSVRVSDTKDAPGTGVDTPDPRTPDPDDPTVIR